MAPTAPSTPDAGAAPGRRFGGVGSGRLPGCAQACAAALVLFAGAAQSQVWRVESSVGSNLTWTSNALLGIDAAKPDVLLEVSPRLAIRGEGSRVRIAGSAALTAIDYVNGTRPSRVLPTADITGRLEVFDNRLFVESGVRVRQDLDNVFGARGSGSGQTAGRRSSTQWRLEPYFESIAENGLHYRARSENVLTRDSSTALAADAPSIRGYFGRHSASVSQDPRPLGWSLEAERSETRYSDSVQPTVDLDVTRFGVDYSLFPGLQIGANVGVERNTFFRVNRVREIYGVELHWRPSERTRFFVSEEHRYFGSGWRLNFEHRSPFLATTLALTRGIESAPQGLLDLPATSNVAALLDALFTTRFQDPVERARQVRLFMSQQGLPESTAVPTNVLSQRLTLASTARASVALVGTRSAVVLGAYFSRFSDAPEAGDFATGRIINNNFQRGVDLTVTHRLSPRLSSSLTFDASRIQALAAAGSDRTTEAGGRAALRLQLASRTAATCGGSVRKLVSSSALTPSGKQFSIFAGLEHGF